MGGISTWRDAFLDSPKCDSLLEFAWLVFGTLRAKIRIKRAALFEAIPVTRKTFFIRVGGGSYGDGPREKRRIFRIKHAGWPNYRGAWFFEAWKKGRP